MIRVLDPGIFTTVQDCGRPGYAHLGVTVSGAVDPASHRLGNRLLGNDEDAASLELTLGGARLQFVDDAVICVTGAPVSLRVGGRARDLCCATPMAAGQVLEVGHPLVGLRTYLAVRGGLDVPASLGSRSTDTLGGVGPRPLQAGDELPVGEATTGSSCAPLDMAVMPSIRPVNVLTYYSGPRADWLSDDGIRAFRETNWVVGAKADRVGVHLDGPPLTLARSDQMFSEGMVVGSVEVPPSGLPIVFLNDHPTTGGYPMIAVVTSQSVRTLAQLTPGNTVRFQQVH